MKKRRVEDRRKNPLDLKGGLRGGPKGKKGLFDRTERGSEEKRKGPVTYWDIGPGKGHTGKIATSRRIERRRKSDR